MLRQKDIKALQFLSEILLRRFSALELGFDLFHDFLELGFRIRREVMRGECEECGGDERGEEQSLHPSTVTRRRWARQDNLAAAHGPSNRAWFPDADRPHET